MEKELFEVQVKRESLKLKVKQTLKKKKKQLPSIPVPRLSLRQQDRI